VHERSRFYINTMKKITIVSEEVMFVDKVIEYFKRCVDEKEMPQQAGLLIHLGVSREEWKVIKEKYPVIANRADHFIEKVWVDRLPGNQSTGVMFYLKNNFYDIYGDKSEHNVTVRTPKPILEGVEVIDVIPEKKR